MNSVSQADSQPDAENTAPPKRRVRFRACFAVVGLVVVAVDTLSKALVVTFLQPGEPVRLAGGTVYFTLIRNSGAAFGMATDFTKILAILALLVAIGIAWYAWRKLVSTPWAIALGLIAGGALGNLVDRVFRAPGFMVGEVVDFISMFHPYGKGWAIFNLADSALVIGVVLVIVLELTGRRVDGSRIAKTPRGEPNDS